MIVVAVTIVVIVVPPAVHGGIALPPAAGERRRRDEQQERREDFSMHGRMSSNRRAIERSRPGTARDGIGGERGGTLREKRCCGECGCWGGRDQVAFAPTVTARRE
jgi:hypothetical protein